MDEIPAILAAPEPTSEPVGPQDPPAGEPQPPTTPFPGEPSGTKKEVDALVAENEALREENTRLEADVASAKTKADEDAELIATLSSSLAKVDEEPVVSLAPTPAAFGAIPVDESALEALLEAAHDTALDGLAPVYNPNSEPVKGQFAGEVHTIPPKTVKFIPRAAADHLCGEANAGGELHHAGVRKLIAATVGVKRALGDDWRDIVAAENERLVAEADSKAIA